MVFITNGLRISATNLDALKSGEIVGAFSKTFLTLDKCFALYPDLQIQNLETVNIEFWAECKSCDSIDNTFSLSNLSRLTTLSIKELRVIFQQRTNIFLVSLRVYRLPNSIEVKAQSTGNFIPLPSAITIIDRLPVLNDEQFREIYKQFQGLNLAIFSNEISTTSVITNELLEVNSNFLSESNTTLQSIIIPENLSLQQEEIIHQKESELDWIKTISTLGDRSIEQDQGRSSNYQAGTDFENISKKSLEFLGFTVDEAYKGGAGGLDLFCSKPYPLTGECKAGKSIPNHTVEELIRLGGTHLGVEGFINLSAKLVIGAGKPTNPMLEAAQQWKVSIIKAMTLQKLVELKAKYDGAINLFELKEYLQAGQIDKVIDEYIQKVEDRIRLRSKIIQAVKELQESDSEPPSSIEIRTHYNARQQGSTLDLVSTKEILIELSSPLVGYLGRVEENGRKIDRFYFLRDLPLELITIPEEK
ncbi:MAG: DUF1802 family protein [Coleofasciculaceae cyanobacterium SM2_1_6]|nr:DUF1802 family protein [Coleofasciculaceae cyanobacterium SM2_1_6]